MISNLETKRSKEIADDLFKIYDKIIHELEKIASTAEDQIVEAVHVTRKRLKFLRAFVKLTRYCENTRDYSPVNYVLRDCGRTISDCRDAHVRGLLLKEFSEKKSFSNLILELTRINNHSTKTIENELFSNGSVFDQIIREITSTEITDYFKSVEVNRDCILKGMHMGYKKSYDVYHSELKSHEAELLHEWRKRTKDLLYHMEAIMDSMPKQVQPSYEEVANLCDVLGQINDLFMFSEWLSDVKKSISDQKDLSALMKELDTQQKKLTKQAEKKGKSVLKKTPHTFFEQLNNSNCKS